jgi:putative ABC transport system permease protein
MMSLLRRLVLRLRNALWPGRDDADVTREIAAHLALSEEEFARRGLSPEAARLAARRALGGVEQTKSLHRAARSFGFIDDARRDAWYAIRTLRHTPGFTAMAVLTLALGIGANTAIFSLVYSALLRALPYANADRVLFLEEGAEANAVTFGNFGSWRERSHEFEAMSAWWNGAVTLSRGDETTRLGAHRATADTWRVLQIPPAAGRYYNAEDDRPGAAPVVVLSYHVWQTQFTGDPRVVGSSVLLDGAPALVVGVAARGYEEAGIAADLWLPASMGPDLLREHADHELSVYGLVRRGRTAATAMAELRGIEQQLKSEYPRAGLDGVVQAMDVRQSIVGNTRQNLLILTAAVAFVLLIACANITNLLLARAVARQKEVAVRAALGASRGRILSQLLIESLVLALAGGACGVAIAYAGFQLFATAASTSLVTLHPEINGAVLGYAAALALSCSVLFGLMPAWRASRTDVQTTLRDAGTRGSRVGEAARNSLVVVELALAVILLAGAGLLIRSAIALEEVPLGFETRDLATMRVALPGQRYTDPSRTTTAFANILDGVHAVPGVQSAALASRLPLFQGSNCGVVVEGQTRDGGPLANFRAATPGYFSLMGLTIRAGRGLEPGDTANAPAVTVINDTLARALFGSASALGHRIAFCPQMTTGSGHWYEVVGVVSAMRSNGLRQALPLEGFMPLAQSPENLTVSLVVRSAQPIANLTPAIRHIVHGVDPLVSVYGVQTLDELVARDRTSGAFILDLLVILGATGLVLAMIGVYGVIAYFVSQRAHEIGVRVAVGASTGRVVALVLRQGCGLAVVGVGLGTLGALAGSKMLESFLFGVTARDPLTFVCVGVVLTLVALVASGIPARRAARMDPVTALKA